MELAKEDIEMIRSLRTYAYNYDDCDDMLQDIYLKILNNLSKFNSLTTAEKKNYAIRAIRNWGIDKNRRDVRKGRARYLVEIDFVEKGISPDVYAKIELKEVMKKGHGNENCARLMLNMEGFNCYEIAKIKGVKSHKTILTNFYNARKFLNK